MNKKIVTLILVILVSFSFLSIVVADNATNGGDNGVDDSPSVDQDKKDDDTPDKDDSADKNKKSDKDKKDNKDKTNDKSKHNYILAKGHGNDIRFSDGFRGFILDYSKSPASSGDEFKHVSASKAPNANTLKLAVVECYRHDMDGSVASIVTDFIKSGSSPTKVGKAVASSSEIVGDTAVVMIDNNTEAVFQFELLKSVSGNESNYFAYKVSFRTIDHVIVQVNQTNDTDESGPESFTNNTTVPTIALNQTGGNETNATFLDGLNGYFDSLLNSAYGAWKPLIDTLAGFALSVVNGIEGIGNMFYGFMGQMQMLIDGLHRFTELIGTIWNEISGFLKLFTILLTSIEQLLRLILSALDFIIGLLQTLISLVQYIIGLILSIINFVMGLINQIIGMITGLINYIMAFITDLINQLTALFNAIFDLLKKVGSSLANVIGNAAIIICAFIIVTVSTFVYDRSKMN
ncbi:hypothetical protein [Methanobrevibacter sp.]|uniref:phage tail protein n=1 Tax=Methanobrevibacter sp. TaxID=66852 RepID=UPI00388EE43B